MYIFKYKIYVLCVRENVSLRYLIYLIYFIDRGQPNWEAIKRKSRKNTNLFTSWKF